MAMARFTPDDVATAVQGLIDNGYRGVSDLDDDDLDEIARIVITALTLRGWKPSVIPDLGGSRDQQRGSHA